VSDEATQRIFAACAPGLEPALARELDGLGLSARAVAGGAEAVGRDAWAVACLGSRAADAVKARLWEGPASGVLAARRELAHRMPGVALESRREGDGATLSADAAGAPLFKRGWRARVGAAPLRESLAAGLLLELGYDGSGPFLDPMCGSGTIAVEAALLAGRRAPGLGRAFAFENWPGHAAARTTEVRKRLVAISREPPAPVLASDRNGGAVRLAGKNAEAAGMERFVRIERRDAADVAPTPGPGVCLVNPPYGIRLDREVEESWRSLGSLLARLQGWTVGVLAGDAAVARSLPGKPVRELEVQNGGIRCRFLVYTS
jgi:putative N6-adenine-specific DNA methylase